MGAKEPTRVARTLTYAAALARSLGEQVRRPQADLSRFMNEPKQGLHWYHFGSLQA